MPSLHEALSSFANCGTTGLCDRDLDTATRFQIFRRLFAQSSFSCPLSRQTSLRGRASIDAKKTPIPARNNSIKKRSPESFDLRAACC
jgi:hypothetical protein